MELLKYEVRKYTIKYTKHTTKKTVTRKNFKN